MVRVTFTGDDRPLWVVCEPGDPPRPLCRHEHLYPGTVLCPEQRAARDELDRLERVRRMGLLPAPEGARAARRRVPGLRRRGRRAHAAEGRVMSDNFVHDVSACGGCDLCLAADHDYDRICDDQREAWTVDMEAAAAAQCIPWDLAWEPAADGFGASEAA